MILLYKPRHLKWLFLNVLSEKHKTHYNVSFQNKIKGKPPLRSFKKYSVYFSLKKASKEAKAEVIWKVNMVGRTGRVKTGLNSPNKYQPAVKRGAKSNRNNSETSSLRYQERMAVFRLKAIPLFLRHEKNDPAPGHICSNGSWESTPTSSTVSKFTKERKHVTIFIKLTMYLTALNYVVGTPAYLCK